MILIKDRFFSSAVLGFLTEMVELKNREVSDIDWRLCVCLCVLNIYILIAVNGMIHSL